MKRRYDRVFERSNSYNFRNEPYNSTNSTSVPASFTRYPEERNHLEYTIAEDYRFNKVPKTEAKDEYYGSIYPYSLQQQSSNTSFPETEVFNHIKYEDSYTYSMNYGKLDNFEEDDDHGDDFDSTDNQNKTFDSESRSIYVGHLPENVIYYDLGKAANEFGPIELMRLVPRKRCAFLNFLNIADARKMMQKYSGSCVPHPEQEPNTENCLLIQNKPVRLSWSNTRPLSEEVRDAIESLDATRNLFVFYGNCMKPVPGQRLQPMTPDELATKFRLFGHIENIVIKPKKNIAFVNVTSITSAINAYRASEDEPGILLRGEKLVVKFSQENEQNYTSDRNDPRNQILGAGFGMGHLGVSPPLPLEPPLPPGWLESFDEKSGCKYYYHSQRRVTQWEHPLTGKTSLSMKSPPSQLDSFVSQNGSTLNSRAVILQNLPETADYQQICTIARPHGVIESVRLHADKHVAFINYVQPESALSLHTQSLRAPYTMGNNILKVNWAKEVPIRPYLLEAIINEGACRSLYLRDLTEAVTEDDIRDAFTEIASTEIESIMLMPEAKPIGFVNFIDIISAKKVLDYYKQNHEGVLTIKGVQMQISYVNVTKKLNKGVPTEYGGIGVSVSGSVNRNTRAECRSVIVSGFPPETLLSDISKAGNLFGQIESVYLNTEKNHAFINYVHPQSAESFVRRSKDSGLEIRGQKVRVGYGKSVPIRHDIVIAINTEGASRSLYVGGIEGENAEERLKEMLSAMCDGVFDSIAVNAEKKYAFVNLASISAAKKVMDECKGGMVLDGMPLKFSYAKTK